MLSAKEFEEYLRVARENGVQEFSLGELRVVMSPTAKERASQDAFNDVPAHPDGTPLTDFDWALAATEGIPMGPPKKAEH